MAVQISNRQKTLKVDRRRIRRAVAAIVRDARISRAAISVAIVDDATIARLHGEFLDDPQPTDVLSFLLECSGESLEGEVVASADTAQACAPRYHTTPEEELLRYVIHGALHLVGYGDATPRQRAAMRRKEREYLTESRVGCASEAHRSADAGAAAPTREKPLRRRGIGR
jgi:probable rRNA maturation factor